MNAGQLATFVRRIDASEAAGQSSNKTLYHDFGHTLTGSWVLRFKLILSVLTVTSDSDDLYLHVGLSNSTVAGGTVQDFQYIRWTRDLRA